jgi:hypothetical protein
MAAKIIYTSLIEFMIQSLAKNHSDNVNLFINEESEGLSDEKKKSIIKTMDGFLSRRLSDLRLIEESGSDLREFLYEEYKIMFELGYVFGKMPDDISKISFPEAQKLAVKQVLSRLDEMESHSENAIKDLIEEE